MTLEELNNLGIMEARAAFELCCGAQRWIDGMLMRKPFGSAADLQNAGREIWDILSPKDWKDAFSHRPRIGDTHLLLLTLTGGEEPGGAAPSEATLQKLKTAYDAYFEKFGYVFFTSPRGKAAAEILTDLESRLANDPNEEIKIAAAEHAKLTAIQLEKLLSPARGA